jgi:hypothetical protein
MICGKEIYNTKGSAIDKLKSLQKDKSYGAGNVYFCNPCGGWHLSGGGKKSGGRRVKKKMYFTDSQEVNSQIKLDRSSRRRNKEGVLRIKNYKK